MREPFQALLAGLLILVIGYFGYTVLFRAPEQAQLLVREASGSVVRTDAVGQQEAAVAGMALHPRDELSVGDGSRAALSIGEDTHLTLEARSAIRVIGVEASGVRVELEGGRVSARVRAGSPTLSISSRGRAVSAGDADFSIAAEADGVLAVATTRGEVALSGLDVEALSAGQQVTALPGEPAVLGPIPDSLLLDVQWPELVATRDEELFIEGVTAPYAEVSLTIRDEQSLIRAGADGRFRAPLRLIEGDNPVQVTARDSMGNREESRRAFERTTTPPQLNVEASWGN
ncbi:MAG: hypothetical protein ACI8S6_005395 [Myxococcota bacterium]|jgi:hypothetical protein